jgi:hypothetical protein
VPGYKLTVYFGVPVTSAGGGESKATITPDIVLTPHAKPFIKQYTSTVVANPALAFFPEGCRTDPTSEPFCDVYRIKLNRSKAKGAINYVVISLEWTSVETPDLQTPLLGLGFGPVPNMDMYVYDQPQHSLDGAGGTTLTMPERVGFVATQDEYDLVVQVFSGATTGYKITAFMTDELFDKPFELLDPITGNPIAPAVDPVTGAFDGSKIDNPAAILPLAPIDVDDQIAGIGLGTTEQFDRAEAIRLGQEALRNVSLESDPPSGIILVLALVVVPAVLLGAGMLVGSAAGAGVGAIAGHAAGGMSRSDLKDIGELLDEGDSALILIAATDMQEKVDLAVTRAKKTLKKQLQADTDSLKKEIDELELSQVGGPSDH